MKLKNVKIGMKVLVKDKEDSRFYPHNRGKIGVVKWVTSNTYLVNVGVCFGDGESDCGHHTDLKLIKEDVV
jgi:hypothetical protein